MKVGAVYIRVSTDEQAREGYSLDAQLKDIKKYARNNNIIIEPEFIFKDEGISGRKAEKRPAFMKMISIAKSKEKKFDVILVHKFDRFSRSREDSIVYKSMLKKECGISVISISEPLDPDDKMSIIIEAFLEAMAEYYSINLSSEVKKGQLEKHDKKELQTNPSFGYKALNNKLEIIKEEAEIVKLIFQQFALEHISMMQIAKNINELGIKTHRGKKFENRTIYYILNNPVYIGKLRYTPGRKNQYDFNDPNTIIVTGKHTPIIDMELWDLTQLELSKNNKWKKPHQRMCSEPKHWTKGLIRCKECGCTMVTCGKTKLRCNGYNKGKCSNHYTIVIEEVYDLIINKILETISTGVIEHIVQKKKQKTTVDTYSIVKNKLDQLTIQEERIKNAYREGIDTLEEYKENKKIIIRERKNLESQLENIKDIDNYDDLNDNRKKEIIENGKHYYEILTNNKISMKEKNEVAHKLINKIEFDYENDTLELYYN